MARKRDWAKLDDDWTGNKKVRKVMRRFGPPAGAYWTMLIARSYAKSHHIDNPTGAIKCTLQDLSDELMDRHDRTAMWEAMIDARLVRITGGDWRTDPECDVVIEVVDFLEWQHPKGSTARRQQELRDREKVRDLQVNVTGRNNLSQVVTKSAQKEKENEKENEKIDLLSEKAPASTDITNVFTHWVDRTYAGRGPKPKLSPKRRTRIKARLADGWTVDQLKQAIDGYAQDAFWRGEQDGKPKLELAYRLGSTEEVERGLSLHDQATATPKSAKDKWMHYLNAGSAS